MRRRHRRPQAQTQSSRAFRGAISRARSLRPAPLADRSATICICMSPPYCPREAGRSAGAFLRALETHSKRTGSGSGQTPRANCPRRKSRRPDRQDRPPPPAESTQPTPAVQPFSLFAPVRPRIQFLGFQQRTRTIAQSARPIPVSILIFCLTCRGCIFLTPLTVPADILFFIQPVLRCA